MISKDQRDSMKGMQKSKAHAVKKTIYMSKEHIYLAKMLEDIRKNQMEILRELKKR